jgi:hypothetical protein
MTDTETVTVEEFRDGVKISTRQEVHQLSPEQIDLRDIKADYKAARANLITANQAVQAAATATAMLPAVKAFATANLQAFQVISRALKYVDGELAGIDE